MTYWYESDDKPDYYKHEVGVAGAFFWGLLCGFVVSSIAFLIALCKMGVL